MITDKQGGHCHYSHYYTGTILRPGLQSATGHSAVIIATSWGGQWQCRVPSTTVGNAESPAQQLVEVTVTASVLVLNNIYPPSSEM